MRFVTASNYSFRECSADFVRRVNSNSKLFLSQDLYANRQDEVLGAEFHYNLEQGTLTAAIK